MRISKKCQYGLQAVFELAVRKTGQPVKIHQIAGAQNIPPRFLEVILNQLRHAGFVESRRGNEGGYMLARDAEELTVGQVIRCMTGALPMVAAAWERVHLKNYGRRLTALCQAFATVQQSQNSWNTSVPTEQQVL
jgi:Rrf2 family protein